MARSSRSRRKKKLTLAQQIVGTAALTLPAPVRAVLSSRWGARLTLLALPLLIGTGLISLDWSEGVPPRVHFNWQKTGEVKQAVVEKAEELKDKLPDEVLQSRAWARTEEALRERLTNVTGGPALTVPPPARDPSKIRIATFNIQVLGESKIQKPEVVRVLADVIRRFDVVAIQELRTTNEAVMETLLAQVNGPNGTYRYVLGPRLGRTVSKEQYVFVFDAARIAIDPQSVLTVPDPSDFLHREPLIARFQARTSPPEAGFSFILVNIHTDPDETKTELNALDDVFVAVQRNAWREDDVILLGDLNVSSQQFGELGQLPHIAWIVDGQPTNTRGSKSYDNIVFNRLATTELTGQAGILSLQTEYGLSLEQALDVSDHLPVWAEFDAFEGGAQPAVASNPGYGTSPAPAVVPGGAPTQGVPRY